MAQAGALDALSYFWLTTVVSLITPLFMTRLFQQSLVVPAATFPFLLGMGLVTHIGGWLSVNYAQGHLPASLVSPTMLGQPVVAALLAFVLLGEALTLLQVVGGAVVLLGISLVHRARG
ncbi:DMT family transporter [Candidatus Amarolinea dominans]|uniref:DMT family transporter n=1 Tax=Candidatus Amarolinea dominans TaxID=3140696 RepID=UPI0031CC71D6